MNSSQNLHSKPIDRQEYKDVGIEDACQATAMGTADIFMPKFDGIWARVEISDELAQVFSRTGQLKDSFGVPATITGLDVEITLVGEFMYGTQWSKHPEREGKIFVFDILHYDGRDMWNNAYSDRYFTLKGLVESGILGPRFSLVPAYRGTALGEWWLKNEKSRDYEGFVLRKWSDPWNVTLSRCKLDITDDFVIIGYNEGTGRLQGSLGSLILGQYDESGNLVEVMTCGGGIEDHLRKHIWLNKQKYFNNVVECVGKARFDSGALRHPNFLRFRTDKLPCDCLLKRQ